jgi:outer membrane protein assembly factor BamD
LPNVRVKLVVNEPTLVKPTSRQTSAIRRFRNVVEDFPNTRHVEEALARLSETYLAMGLESEAQTAAAVLGHNFPDSEWYDDTYRLLQSGGLEPRENTGSWLSRAGAAIVGS